MLFGFGRLITYWWVRIAFRMRYVGLENIPRDKGFILACNHRSYHDPLFIAHKVPQPIHYMAKAELFRTKLRNWLFRNVNAFPVSRGTGDTSAIRTAEEVIRSGDVLGIFPEGTRSKDGKPLRPRSGVALIAGQTGADVLPCAVCFEGNKLRFRIQVTVCYGKLITSEELNIDPAKPSTVRAASKRIMADIVELLDQGGEL